MSRYVAVRQPPEAEWDWSVPPTIVHPTVSVGPPVDTGLLDAQGRRIYRIPDEVGFVPRRPG
jgi:hypothetical protein